GNEARELPLRPFRSRVCPSRCRARLQTSTFDAYRRILGWVPPQLQGGFADCGAFTGPWAEVCRPRRADLILVGTIACSGIPAMCVLIRRGSTAAALG